jgi:hypothetical protein
MLAETVLAGKHIVCRFDGRAVVIGLATAWDDFHQ